MCENKLAWVQVVSVCTWEEGLEMGIRQHPTCPREVVHPGLPPVWALRMKGQEAQMGWLGTDGAGLRTQGLALQGEVELVPNARRWGRQCRSGLNSLPQQFPRGVPGESGVGGEPGASLACPGDHISQHQGQVVPGEGRHRLARDRNLQSKITKFQIQGSVLPTTGCD